MIVVTRIGHNKINESNQGAPSVWIKGDGTPVDMELVDDAIEASLQDLAQNYPAVYTVLSHKDLIKTDNPRIDTLCTDGVSIFYNPAFIEWLIDTADFVAVEYVLIHEALHVLFDHCNINSYIDRFSDMEKVNWAQDYEINYVIENFIREGITSDAGFKGLTEKIGGLINNEYGKKGLTWEEIYDKIPAIDRKVSRQKTSDEWKQGFEEGFNEILNELRSKNLVESYEIR